MNRKAIRIIAGLCLFTVVLGPTACGKKDSGADFIIDLAEDYDTKIEGSGNLSSNAFDLSADHTYKLVVSDISYSNSSFKVIVEPSGNNAVIEADDNALDDLRLIFDDSAGTITLSGTKGTMFSNVSCTVTLNASVNAINADGSVTIDYQTPENVDRVDISASGAVKIMATGSSEKAVYEFSGSAALSAEELKANDVTIDASGATKCAVYADNSLDATASGTSSITYSGSPGTVNENVSDMASVNKN